MVQVQSIEVSVRFNLSFSVNEVALQFVDSGRGKKPLQSRVVDDQCHRLLDIQSVSVT